MVLLILEVSQYLYGYNYPQITPCMVPLQNLTSWGPFYWHSLTLIPAWISNYIHYKVWDEITYPFPNFNGVTVEVWEWISNFIPCFLSMWFLIHAGIILKGATGDVSMIYLMAWRYWVCKYFVISKSNRSIWQSNIHHFDGVLQDRSNSSALAMELL